MSDDLKERLRAADRDSTQRILGSRIFREAADRIESLEKALEPFARAAENDHHKTLCLGEDIDHWSLSEEHDLTLGDIRRALLAVKGRDGA